jgi:hypothetical protein
VLQTVAGFDLCDFLFCFCFSLGLSVLRSRSRIGKAVEERKLGRRKKKM